MSLIRFVVLAVRLRRFDKACWVASYERAERKEGLL